jgi:hypothetical protein
LSKHSGRIKQDKSVAAAYLALVWARRKIEAGYFDSPLLQILSIFCRNRSNAVGLYL